MMDIKSFNCLGTPIIIKVCGKKVSYMYLDDNSEYTYGTLHELRIAAAHFRDDPEYYIGVRKGKRKNMSEWAFVIEQLVAEGTL